MSSPVGGRGHKAPYLTTHVRVPEPVKPEVERLISDYKAGNLGVYVSRHDLTSICKDIMRQKKSARQSLNNLLTALLGEGNTV